MNARGLPGVVWLAGPFPTMAAAWARRGPIVELLREHGGHVIGSGVGTVVSTDDGPMPRGALNHLLPDRYWTDESDRLHCLHGLILHGTQCVECERKAL